MSDEVYSFSTARTRLDEIVTQVRKKDTSLEKSLDLLEEGVRLANACTELIDHADWTVGGAADVTDENVVASESDMGAGSSADAQATPGTDDEAVAQADEVGFEPGSEAEAQAELEPEE